MGMWVCKACWTLNLGRSGCKGDRCSGLEPIERAAQAARSIAAVAPESILIDPSEDNAFTPLSSPEPACGPSLRTILQNTRPLLRHVPRGARTAWAGTLATIVNDLASTPSWEALQRLFLFPRWCLMVPVRAGKSHRRDLASYVTRRCNEFLALSPSEAWARLPDPAIRPPEPRMTRRRASWISRDASNPTAPLDDATLRAIRTFVEEGAPGKAVNLLLSEGCHNPKDPGVLAKLQALHPSASPPSEGTGSHAADPEHMWHDLESRRERLRALDRAIRDFPPASAAGPSGLRPQHLQDAIKTAEHGATQRLLIALDRLALQCESGHIHDRIAEWLCASRLVPLKKKGDGVRPIAIGDTLRRLFGKRLMRAEDTVRALATLRPHQLGFNGQGACEMAGTTLQACIDALGPTGNWACLSIDIINAFNTIDRNAILASLRTRAPHLVPWAQKSLGQPTLLFCANHTISSEQGVQQGDPLGPLLFAMGIQPAIEKVSMAMTLAHQANPAQSPPLHWHRWYFDDGTLVGTLPQLNEALTILGPALASLGCSISAPKTTIWGPGTATGLTILPATCPAGSVLHVPWTPTSGVTVLGCPIHPPGCPSYLEQELTATVAKLEKVCSSLRRVPDPQVQIALLRTSVNACRLNYLFRTCNTSAFTTLLSRADLALRSCMQTIVGFSHLSDHHWDQSTLPLALGGLGIRTASDSALPARLSAILQWLDHGQVALAFDNPLAPWAPSGAASTLITMRDLLGPVAEPLASWIAHESIEGITPAQCTQKYWANRLYALKRRTLETTSSSRDSIRLSFQEGTTATAWLTVPPSPALGNACPPSQFRLLLRWFLGIPILEESLAGKPCPLCGDPVDIYGDHAVSCDRGKKFRRHFAIQDWLAHLLQSHGIPCARERMVDPSSLLRPADIFIPNWSVEGDLALDVTVRHPLPPSLFPATITSARDQLQRAETDKRALYSEMCSRHGCQFQPMVFTTWGGLHGSGIPFARDLFLKVTLDRTGTAQIETENELRASLSMRLMKEVAVQLETLSMVREAAWDDSFHQPGVLDDFDPPKVHKKPRTAHPAPSPSGNHPNLANLRPHQSHKTALAGRSHQPYHSSDDDMEADSPRPPPHATSSPCP